MGIVNTGFSVTDRTGIALGLVDCAMTVSEGTGRKETIGEVNVEAGVCIIVA